MLVVCGSFLCTILLGLLQFHHSWNDVGLRKTFVQGRRSPPPYYAACCRANLGATTALPLRVVWLRTGRWPVPGAVAPFHHNARCYLPAVMPLAALLFYVCCGSALRWRVVSVEHGICSGQTLPLAWRHFFSPRFVDTLAHALVCLSYPSLRFAFRSNVVVVFVLALIAYV